MARIYRVGTRKSPLAIMQVEEILESLRMFYPDLELASGGIDTYGDKDKATPISEVEGSDFFTREIDKALLEERIDFAIHSAKDLPDALEEELVIAAITESIDPYDVLVSKSGLKLRELPYGAKIGTSSKRRKEALKKFRPDFQIVDIRGNIEERLSILDNNSILNTQYSIREIDAIVIAAAGLIRLGLEDRTTQRIPFEIIEPHPLQGRLAVVARLKAPQLIKFLSVIDSREAVYHERKGLSSRRRARKT